MLKPLILNCMKINRTRRFFIRNTALTAVGIALVPSAMLAKQNKKNFVSFKDHVASAPNNSDLRTFPFVGKQLTVKGCVYDKSGLYPLANASIEVWHLSPNSNKFSHKAKLVSNASGAYLFQTDFPNKEEGKAPRIYFKLSHGATSYSTELLVSDYGAHVTGEHWERNKQLESKLFPKKTGTFNASTITFNLSI